MGGGESTQIRAIEAADFSFADDCKLNRLREAHFVIECVDKVTIDRWPVSGSDRPTRSQLGNGHGVLLVDCIRPLRNFSDGRFST
jgi:hypothetical protein